MNINTLKSENYKWVKENFDNPEENIRSLEYIQKLAMLTGTDITNWDLLKILKHDGETSLPTDEREINRRFFLKEDYSNPDLTGDDQYYLEKSEELIRGYVPRQRLQAIESLESDIRNARENLETKTAELNRLRHTNMVKYKPKKPFSEQVRNIIKGNWSITQLDVGRIKVKTKSDIFISYKNEDHGVDMELNLGRFFFTIDLWRESVLPEMDASAHRVSRRGNTLVDGVYLHPHIRFDSICWGEEKTTMLKALANGDLETVLERLYAVLTQYNHNDPYIEIARFYKQQILDGKIARTYDSDGYDMFGYDKSGYSRSGYDYEGYDRDGFDSDGYDRDGESREDEDRCPDCEYHLDDCECEQDGDF